MTFSWEIAADLATGAGTLVLAVATFGATRSANRSARTAERALAAGLRPLLIGSRPQDPPQKVGFADEHWTRLDGGHGSAEVTREAIYLVMSLRNAGAGVAVLHSWDITPSTTSGPVERPDPAGFRRLTRDIYVPTGDVGFWQGALRDPSAPEFEEVRRAVADRRPMTVDLLYGDVEGGQRVISRFLLAPAGEDAWLANAGRHWNVDRPDPR